MSTEPPRTSRAAVLSLVLGLLSPLLSLATAIPAWVLGLRALRAINASDGRLRGQRLAIAGLVLGIAGTVATAVAFVALVLLHVNAVSDRAGCANNLRRLGLAVNLYHDQNKDLFPPATVNAPKLPPEKRVSWYVSVLPFVGPNPPGRAWLPLVGQVFDPAVPWDRPPNESAAHRRVVAFLCPSSLRRDPPPPAGVTTYVGLAGIDPDAARLPKTSPRAGFFGYDRTISREDVGVGISFTTMVAETERDLGPWVAGGPPTVRGLDPEETTYVGPGRPFGGLHPGGGFTLRVDGSARFVPDSIPPDQFQDMATLAGRND
jgi:hypothetical protein